MEGIRNLGADRSGETPDRGFDLRTNGDRQIPGEPPGGPRVRIANADDLVAFGYGILEDRHSLFSVADEVRLQRRGEKLGFF